MRLLQKKCEVLRIFTCKADDVDFKNSRIYQMEWLKEQGFEVVEGYEVTAGTIEERVKFFSEKIADNDFPSDGLVLVYDDIAYGSRLVQPPSSREIPLRLNGQMRSERRPFLRLSGVRQEQGLSIRLQFLNRWNWKGRQ